MEHVLLWDWVHSDSLNYPAVLVLDGLVADAGRLDREQEPNCNESGTNTEGEVDSACQVDAICGEEVP